MATCLVCNRQITDRASKQRQMGPACWKKHLAELDETERHEKAMLGYNFIARGGDVYLVLSPRHDQYEVDLSTMTCTCPAWAFRRNCKHIEYILREVRQIEENRKEDEGNRLAEQDRQTRLCIETEFA